MPERHRAIRLRKQGKTYGEILSQIPVAKSTLSLWLRSIGLAKRQKQNITKKRLAAAQRGANARRVHRILEVEKLRVRGVRDIGRISKRELFLIGVALYWAEGTKQYERTPSQHVVFSNSDPAMIRIFLVWLREVIGLSRNDYNLSVYIHDNNTHRLKEVRAFWALHTGESEDSFAKMYFKRHNPRTVRKKVGTDYYGLVRIDVPKSTGLNRKIGGWIQGIAHNWGVV